MKMDKQTHFEKIEQFLAGKLKGKALENFEQQLQTQEDFAQEVDLHKQLKESIKHSPEDDLRANLNKLANRHSPSPAKKRFSPWGIMAIIILFGGLSLWFFINDSPIKKNPVIEEKINEPSTPSIDKEAPVNTKKVPTQKEEQQKKVFKKEQKVKPERKNIPIAANLEINPVLDSQIGNATRGGDYHFTIKSPKKEAYLKTELGVSVFEFSGLLETDESDISSTFQVHLFSNKKEDYENFDTKLTLPLEFNKKEDGVFEFSLTQRIKLSPGLFYYLLEDADSGEIIFVDKVFNL